MPPPEDQVHRGYRAELQRIALITIGLLVVGSLLDHVTLTLLAGGFAYLAWSLHHVRKVLRWIDSDSIDYPPFSLGIWDDLTEHLYRQRKKNRTTEASLRALTERIVLLTAALDEGMLTLNRDGTLEWFNPAAGNLLHLRKDDRGQPITNLVRDPAFLEFIQQRHFDHTLELLAADDRTSLLFSAAVFGDGEIVVVVRDVTRLRQLENMRKDFVANISHELRTPLTVLSGYLESLEDAASELSPTWQRAITQMSQQTGRMNNLANDLLMLSRMESLDARTDPKPVALQPMLEQIVAEARSIADDRFTIELDCPMPVELLGQASELTSVFSNLVVNAVRHNPDGVRIRVTVELDEELRVTVSDNGIGIDPKHLPRLTERFYRVESSRSSGTGGTGLGLAIVKHALNRHDARLEIQSTLSKGSRFICHFPLNRVTSGTQP